MGGAVHGEPFIAANFSTKGFVVNTVVEHFGAAAGHGVEACGNKVFEHRPHGAGKVFANSAFAHAGKVNNFNSGEGFEVDLRRGFMNGLQKIGVITEWQLGVQAADDVHFGGACVVGVAGLLGDVVEGVFVGAVLSGLAMELAKLARKNAKVGVI